MLKNGSFINEVSRAGHVNACAFALRRKTVSLFSVIIAIMLASVVLGGCSKPAEQDSGPVYAGETVYKEGAAIPDCPEDSISYKLLRYVTVPEYIYFGGVTGGAPIFTRELKTALLRLKNCFASAVAEGYDLTEEELEELDANTKNALYLEYQTDSEIRSRYEQEFDTYDAENFCNTVYGIPFEWYMQVKREQAAADKYVSALEPEIAPGVSEDRVWEYYLSHKSDYDYAEAEIILTARAPEDKDEALRQAQVAAEEINAASDKKAAFEDSALQFPETLDWREESGSAVLIMSLDYTGLYGEIQKRVIQGEENCYALEHENCIYVILCSFGAEYTKEQLSENGLSDTIRTMIARAEAEEAACGYGINDIKEIALPHTAYNH